MARPITVKCFLSTFRNEGIEIRRFIYKDVVNPTVYTLKVQVKELYPQLQGEKFDLMYLDEDQDKIAVTTDAELNLAWEETVESGAQFRLYIFISGT